MVQLRWDVRDVFRAGRYAFSGKKITIHFKGLLFFYLTYEALLYLSLLISGTDVLRAFWEQYALIPVCPFVDFGELGIQLPVLTQIAMWIGMAMAFVMFFMTSTAVSKIAIEQLRGDDFYTMKEARGFMKQYSKSIFGTFLVLVAVFLFCIIWPVLVGLLGKIPAVGNVFVLLAALLLIPAFFLGLFMVLLLVVILASLFFTPAVTAVESQDSFENVYQLFSLVWNQPWRTCLYEDLLLLIKLICVPLFAAASLAAISFVLIPLQWLIPETTTQMLTQADHWLGGTLSGLQQWLPILPFSISPALGDTSVLVSIAAVLLTALWICIALMVVAYLFSIASTGNTLIYVVMRYKTSKENLLEVPEEDQEPDLSTEVSSETPISEAESTEEVSSVEETSETSNETPEAATETGSDKPAAVEE